MITVLRREVSPLDDTYATFVLLTGIALNPTWRLTEKINVTATLDYSDRDYLTEGLLLVTNREDSVRTAGVRLAYRALRAVTLDLSAMRQTRSSPVAFDEYEVTIVGAGLRVGF
jgi:lactam utilization protein B